MNDKSKANGVNGNDSIAFKIDFIPLDNLIPSAMNKYSVADVAELKASIELIGLMQNLTVRRIEDMNLYEIISGHRRFKALQELHAGDYTVPCNVVKTADDVEAELRLILANSTSRDLTDYERTYQAGRLKELLAEYEKNGLKITGRKREIVAELLNVSPAQVGRMESINKNLTPGLKQEYEQGNINITTAYELSKLDEAGQEAALADSQIGKSLTPDDAKKRRGAGKKESEADETPRYVLEVGESLKPCPFCGGKPIIDRAEGGYWIFCKKCKVRTESLKFFTTVKETWNKRI